MGIYDRDYYREKRGLTAFDGRVQACLVLVGLYVLVFLLQSMSADVRRNRPDLITQMFVLDSELVLAGEVWRLVTYALLHDRGLLSMFFDCLFLIWFGRHIEEMLGWLEFVCFYFAASILGGIVFTGSAQAMGNFGYMAGPACSITAVLFLYALHYPRQTVLIFFVLPCPIWFLIGFYVLFSVVGLVNDAMNPAVFIAHAAAAGFTFLYFRNSWRISNWLPGMPSGERRPKRKTNLHIYQGEEERSPAPPAKPAAAAAAPKPSPATPATVISLLDEHLEAKLDEVLEKVKKHGQESLTEEERAVLFRASEIYRKRRKSGGA